MEPFDSSNIPEIDLFKKQEGLRTPSFLGTPGQGKNIDSERWLVYKINNIFLCVTEKFSDGFNFSIYNQHYRLIQEGIYQTLDNDDVLAATIDIATQQINWVPWWISEVEQSDSQKCKLLIEEFFKGKKPIPYKEFKSKVDSAKKSLDILDKAQEGVYTFLLCYIYSIGALGAMIITSHNSVLQQLAIGTEIQNIFIPLSWVVSGIVIIYRLISCVSKYADACDISAPYKNYANKIMNMEIVSDVVGVCCFCFYVRFIFQPHDFFTTLVIPGLISLCGYVLQRLSK